MFPEQMCRAPLNTHTHTQSTVAFFNLSFRFTVFKSLFVYFIQSHLSSCFSQSSD